MRMVRDNFKSGFCFLIKVAVLPKDVVLHFNLIWSFICNRQGKWRSFQRDNFLINFEQMSMEFGLSHVGCVIAWGHWGASCSFLQRHTINSLVKY